VVLAGSSATVLPQTAPRAAGLFVVDPRGNLTQAAAAEQTYRRLFPDATVLSGRQASRAQLLLELGNGPRWMHFDGHGRFDPAFPELSSLELADGEVIGDELAEVAGRCELINLSGCKTGRSPVSADSGRFGLAGPLIRAGVLWVVVSRSDLDDGIAADFNAAFYRALGEEFDPPEAFRVSISSVSQRYSPAAWGGLLLVGRPLQR
jgi:CHAT domain-containing protein